MSEIFVVGEQVTLDSTYNGLEIATVTKITPTGRIIVTTKRGSELTFNPDGSERGRGMWPSTSIRKTTQTHRDMIESIQLRIVINKIEWAKLPIETLREVVEVVRKNK